MTKRDSAQSCLTQFFFFCQKLLSSNCSYRNYRKIKFAITLDKRKLYHTKREKIIKFMKKKDLFCCVCERIYKKKHWGIYSGGEIDMRSVRSIRIQTSAIKASTPLEVVHLGCKRRTYTQHTQRAKELWNGKRQCSQNSPNRAALSRYCSLEAAYKYTIFFFCFFFLFIAA